jgi:hypothetical protein
MDRCGVRQNVCLSACAGKVDQQRAAEREKKARQLPCGVENGKVQPCTEKQEQKLRESLNKRKGKELCQDEQGNLTACPEALRRTEELLRLKAPCKDANGIAIRCPR